MRYTSLMLTGNASATESRKLPSIDYQPHRTRSAGVPLVVPPARDHSVVPTDEGNVEDVAVVETISAQTVSVSR